MSDQIDLILLSRNPLVEAEWLARVLGPTELTLVDSPDSAPVYPGAIYVYSSIFPMRLPAALLEKIRAAGGCGLIHIGDEYYRGDFSQYAAFGFVIRMMSFDAINVPGVFALPLGVTGGLGEPVTKASSQRKLNWIFAGDYKADRKVMAAAFAGIEPNLLSLPISYMGQTGIARADYIAGMADAVFAPCPAGNVCIETFRPYEALHFGAIPIVPKRAISDPYKDVLGSHPMPSFTSWKKAAAFANDLLADPAGLDQLQSECLAWWAREQEDLSDRLARFVREGRSGAFHASLEARFGRRGVSWLRRMRALLVQQNAAQTSVRASFHVRKVIHKLRTGNTLSGTWSLSSHQTPPDPPPGRR